MVYRSSRKRRPKKGDKNIWHLYGLQSLVPTRFIHIVNGILAGRFGLIGTPGERKSEETKKK